jgi:hypothetical protein
LLGHGAELQHDVREHVRQSPRVHLDAHDGQQLLGNPVLLRVLELERNFELWHLLYGRRLRMGLIDVHL